MLDAVGTPPMRLWFGVSPSDRPASPTLAAFKGFVARRGKDFLPG